ncbi:thiazole synthase [Micromonospora pallida]|uniref:thiazole synthase n=1 Tax=Micromonospora pallida TaxID=145854 RepID=A0A1C6SDG7_9ACTN|nr:thiazole synthase [Micromonospora pallida]
MIGATVFELFHCFGAKPEHQVSADVAARMLGASKCRYLAVNTHTIASVETGDELPVGYADATLGSVTALLGPDRAITPVLNINHPVTAGEAVQRARRAVELTGVRIIKLEVLDADTLTTSHNDAVLAAARQLVDDGLEVWPLISADVAAYRAALELGVPMVRVMGSPIGARRGIDDRVRAAIDVILAGDEVPVMLDGGIGSVADLTEAIELGFESALVNSCLFTDGADPVEVLARMRAAVDAAALVPRG